jgi:hypothetical protein
LSFILESMLLIMSYCEPPVLQGLEERRQVLLPLDVLGRKRPHINKQG